MKPKMIYFDYGNTLVYEVVNQHSESLRGVYNSIINKHDVNFEEFFKTFQREKEVYREKHHPFDIEFKYEDLFENLFKRFKLKSELNFEEISRIYFDDYAPGYAMEGAAELLDFLEEEKISFGVISNLSWSSDVLRHRLENIFNRHMGPVLTTGDWVYRKPDSEIFKIAANISGFEEKDIWYVGDNPLCDIYGAKEAGMKPIYFKSKTENVFIRDTEMIKLDFEHIDIDHLVEIIEILRGSERDGLQKGYGLSK